MECMCLELVAITLLPNIKCRWSDATLVQIVKPISLSHVFVCLLILVQIY